MNIGGLSIAGRAVLAPMAGVTDRAFRELCVRFGAAFVISEMVSSKGLQYNDKKTGQLMLLSEEEHPAAIQLFGCEPEAMAHLREIGTVVYLKLGYKALARRLGTNYAFNTENQHL